MRWSERIKLTLDTFKRVALPIYGWYFIFAFVGLGLLIVGLLPFVMPLVNKKGGSFPNPNPPMPPGNSFSSGLSPFSDNLASYLAQAPYFFLIFVIILLLSWLVTSAFMTGMFNLTQKGLHEKVLFRDFRFSGISRVLGWYGILTLVSFLVIVAGIIGAFALRGISYALPLFAGLYVLFLIALGIFLAPWLSTSVFYMLNHRELSFKHSLSGSWDFYRRNMGSLWLFFITLIGIQILLSFTYQASQTLYILVALLAGPFTAILPIVWVLSLEEEVNQQPLDSQNTTTQGQTWTSPQLLSESSLDEPTRGSSGEPSEDPSNESICDSASPSSTLSSSTSASSFSSTFPASSANPTSPEPSSAEVPPDSVNYCPTCGQKTRYGAHYCAQCGTKL